MSDTPPQLPPPVDWPTIAGVMSIAAMGIIALLCDRSDAKDIAIAAVSALAGWIAHKVAS